MALKPLNVVDGLSVGETPIDVIDANGNVTANNLTVSGTTDLGPIGNITITGGVSGQFITTDGAGNLSFANGGNGSAGNSAAPMPYFIPTGTSYIVNENFQGLFTQPIDIEGEFEVDGILIEVTGGGGNGGGSPGGANTQLQYNDAGIFGGSANLTYNKSTGVITVPNLVVTGTTTVGGDIIPNANVLYSLGNDTHRFNDLFLSGTTITLGNSTLSANSTSVVITNPQGGKFVLSGNANTSTSVLANGNSNITIANNSSIGITANGVSNVVLITKTGTDITGNLGVTGNITGLGDITSLGNLSGVDLTATGNLSVTGDVSAGNVSVTGSFDASGNLSGININTSGDLSVIGNGNIQTNLYVGTNAIVSTRLTVGNPNGAQKTDLFSNGYGSFTNIDVSGTGDSGHITGNTLNLASNLNVTGTASIGTLITSAVNSLGNVTAANMTANGAIVASGNLTVSNASLGNLAVANFFQGDGRYLSNISVSGGTSIVNGTSNVFVEPDANVIVSINGNSNVVVFSEGNAYFESTVVANNAVETTVVRNGNVSMTIDPAGTWIAFNISNGNVLQLHDDYILVTGESNLYGNTTITGLATVTGNLSVTGNANATNVNASNILSTSANITGNLVAGNIDGGNAVSANYFVGDGHLISNITVQAGSQILNGNSNVSVAPNANVTISAEGNANVVTVTGNSVIFDKEISTALITANVANANVLNANSLAVKNALTINAYVTANGLTINSGNGYTGSGTFDGNLSVGGQLFVTGYANFTSINLGQYVSLDAGSSTINARYIGVERTLTTANLSVSGNLSATGNANFSVADISGNLTAGNINGGNLVTANYLAGDGYLISNLTVPAGSYLLNGTSNLYVDGSGNIRMSVDGTANVIEVSNTGAVITGTLSTTGNANTGNLGTATILASGNLTANKITSNGNVSGTNLIASGNITGANANLGNTVTANYFVGDGYLLSNLTIPTGTAIINGSSNVLVTANSNVNITVNGTPNVVQVTEGGAIFNGNIDATGYINGATFANGSSNIAITNNGPVDVSINGVDSIFSVTSTGVYANAKIYGLAGLSVTGNANIGNIGVSGIITTPGQVSAGNLVSSGDLTVAGNANLANVRITGSANVIGNVSGGNLVTTGIANVAGLYVGSTGANINGYTKITANLDVTGNINVTGNLNYSNVTDLVVGDPLIYMGANNTGDIVDLGMVASYNAGTYYHTGLARNHTNDTWTFFDGVVQEPTTVIDWANAVYPTVKLGNLTATGNASVAGNIEVTGNVSANYFSGNVTGNITGNISVGSNTQVLFSDSGLITGNSGLTFNKVTGTLTANLFAGALTTAAQPNITSLGILSSLTVTGNVTAGNLIGPHANGNSNVNIPTANGNVNISAAGTANVLVITGTGANISGTLNSTGNANVGNLGTAGLITATGNITGGNLVTSGLLSVTSNANVGNLGTAGLIVATGNVTGGNLVTGGVLSVTGNANVGNLGTAGLITATGNITGGNLVTGGALSVTGNANVGNIGATGAVFTGNVTFGNISGGNLLSANYISGTLTTAAQPNITSVGTLSSLTATGNITAGNILGVYANGNSNVSIPSANGNVTISAAGNANIVVVTGTGANITGNLNVSGKSNLGSNGNVIITGGSANYVLSTDGAGNLSWVAQSGGGGGSANIAIYDEGSLLTSSVGSMNFEGSGVIATAVGNAVTITVTSGGSGSTAGVIVNSFTGNGVQTAFTLTDAPGSINNTLVNIDGVDQLKTAYSVAGTTLTFSSAPSNGASIDVTIITGVSNVQPSFTTRNYSGNGVQTAYTVSNGVTSTGILVLQNGLMQVPDTDYTVSGNTLTFTSAPSSGQAIQIRELGTVVASGMGPATVTTDTFTGNGVQTTFTLSTAPANKYWTTVNYNGTILLHDAYNVNGSSLVLSAAAANGANIEVTSYGQLGGLYSLINGTSNVNIPSANGNINMSAAGNANVVVVDGTGATITGNLTVTGNVVSGGGSGATSARALGYSLVFGL